MKDDFVRLVYIFLDFLLNNNNIIHLMDIIFILYIEFFLVQIQNNTPTTWNAFLFLISFGRHT